MSIKNNVEEVMRQIGSEGGETIGDELRKQSVKAIKAGEGSKEWKEYMNRFAKDENQLARLLPTDDTQGDYEMDVARAYLVGNGVCGAETTRFHLLDGIGDKLYDGLAGSYKSKA